MHEEDGKECSQLQSVLSRAFIHLMSCFQDKKMHRRESAINVIAPARASGWS